MIRRLRRANGWSQARLAEILNAAAGRDTNTRHDVYRWEAGNASLSCGSLPWPMY